MFLVVGGKAIQLSPLETAKLPSPRIHMTTGKDRVS
jgi:hypothetical protein